MISSQLQSDVMTPAVAQGTAQAAEAREDLITLAGFPLSLPCGFDSSCVESTSRLQSDSDETELDITIPEVPALDELAPEDSFSTAIDCTGCPNQTADKLCRLRILSPTGPISCPRSLKLETTGITRQVTAGKLMFGELWKAATTHKFSVAAKLREAGMREEADSLEDCHSRLIYGQCDNCHKVQVFRNRCDRFYCPECQPKLAKRRAASVAWWTVEIGQPKHVVLTVQNVMTLNRGHVDEIKKWFTRLRHRKFARNWRGGFYSLEVTNEGRGWHLHLHVLADVRWIDAGELARQWAAVTNGFGKIVKVKDCRKADYLAEVTKYAVKGSELAAWEPQQIADFIRAFTGCRTFGVFGTLYGKRTEFAEWLASIRDHKPKCDCGCQTMRFFSEAEWLERDFKPNVDSPDRPAPPTVHPELKLGKLQSFNFRSALLHSL